MRPRDQKGGAETQADDAAQGEIVTEDGTTTQAQAFDQRCDAWADSLCGGWTACRGSVPTGCVNAVGALRKSPGKFQGLADAARAGKLALDPGRAAQCQAAIAALCQHCGNVESGAVRLKCLFA